MRVNYSDSEPEKIKTYNYKKNIIKSQATSLKCATYLYFFYFEYILAKKEHTNIKPPKPARAIPIPKLSASRPSRGERIAIRIVVTCDSTDRPEAITLLDI